MPRVSGTYSLPPSYRATSGQTIRTEQHNPPLEDIAVALTQSVPRDGSAPMTGNLPMNGLRITNLGAATQASDAVRRDQVTLYSAYLSSVAGLALEANQLVYATGAGIAGKTAFTALGRTLVGNSTPALMRATLEVPDVIDEDSFATNSATRPPSQQSVKAYVNGSLTAATNGSVTLPNGLIMKWGKVTGGGAGETTVTFPTAFPTAIYNVQVTVTGNAGAGANNYSYARSASTTGVIVGRDPDAFWTAIGR